MKKTQWIIVVAAAVVVLSALLVFRDKAAAPTAPGSSQAKNSVVKEELNSANAKYVEYTDSVIASSAGKKVLFFHAKWCPQCRQIESDILAGPLPDGWTIIKVDYDNSQDLRKKHGVTLQTTFIKVDDDGNTLGKFVAYDEPKLAAIKQNFLDK